MAKNDFLARQKQREQEVFDAGMRDPEVMGKDTFGAKRIVAVLQGVKRLMDEFHPAFDKCDEADYYQEKLDRLLREAYGDEIKEGFFAFHDRYECVKKQDYLTGKWK